MNRLGPSSFLLLVLHCLAVACSAPTACAQETVASASSHWAYQPLQRTEPGQVKDAEWPRGRIDRYILAALEAKACAPAPDADKSVLERRVTFDLTGLPPVPGEEDDLATDGSPDAFTRLVDRLLASPRFGERWGRHWLDVARYGESVGLRGLIFTEAWRFRDYVIDAFNRDVPFTDFVEEQIAGDLLPHASLEERRRRLTATGFLALGNTNLEEQDKKLLDMDVVDEQLDTIGKAFLAQTIGCARCHDHKFDPISTREYYAMAGILRSTRTLIHANVSSWIDAPLPLESGAERPYAEHEAAVAALEAEVKAARMVAATIVAARDLPGIVIDCAQARAVGEWKHSQQLKRYVGDGYLHDIDAGKGEKTLTFLLELPRAGRYEVRFAYIHGPDRAARVPVTVFHAGGETTVHVDQRESPPIDGHFASLGQFRFEQNGFAHILVSNEGTKGYVTADAVQLLPAEGLARATGTAPEPRAAAADLKTLEEKLKSLREGGPRRPMYMTVKEGERIEDAPIHVRGSVHDLGPPVPRGFLSTLTRGPEPRIPAEESGRRELARWIVSHASHVTARVFVNRAWHWLMGAGIVRTTDNFGTMGELPSHPELLDDLALRFVEDGWSVKRLVREIVLSRTYALGTEPMDAGLASDPENRLRWRAQRRRLEAECIRDAVLSASGELRLEMGGRAFPPGVAADFGFELESSRRSIYVPAFRNALPEAFKVFDFPTPGVVTGVRDASTSPAQALFLLNDPFIREQASLAARRALREPGRDDGARLESAYRAALGRPPAAAEAEIALRHLRASRGNEARSLEAWTEIYQALFACVDFRHLH